MVKVTNPLMSGDARGKFGNKMIFTRGGQVRRYFKPRNPNTPAQQAVRQAFKEFSVPGLTQEQADLLYSALLHQHDNHYSPLGHLHPISEIENVVEPIAYIPVLSALGGTPPTIGNGSLVGSYAHVNGVVTYKIEMQFGSTSTFGSNNFFWTLSLPPFANSGQVSGWGLAYDYGVQWTVGPIVHGGSAGPSSLTHAIFGFLTGASPFVWGALDGLALSGSYLAA